MPGWARDENGALRRETIHHMGRRCRNWDYRCDAVYLITLALADRTHPLLGRLVVERPLGAGDFVASDEAQQRGGEAQRQGGEAQQRGGGPRCDPAEVKACVELSDLGRAVDGLLGELPLQWPGVELLERQFMPEHLHFVIAVKTRQKKPLGAVVGSFKSRSSSLYRARFAPHLAARGQAQASGGGGAQSASLWAAGFVDNILFDSEAVGHALAYVRDNPRRLAVKRLFPELFKVLREVKVSWREELHEGRLGRAGLFSAIGNTFLLDRPHLVQVQCSRSEFAYRRVRNARGEMVLVKDSAGRNVAESSTTAFDDKLASLLAAAKHGAVLVSPCISDGEREIAARAFAAGASVVALQNKGFSSLYKPGGRLFDRCAAGNLLMLAPVAWPYQPGEKRMTRQDALTLNRIAQLVCGSGAAEINYRGARLGDIVGLVAEATSPHAAKRDVGAGSPPARACCPPSKRDIGPGSAPAKRDSEGCSPARACCPPSKRDVGAGSPQARACCSPARSPGSCVKKGETP